MHPEKNGAVVDAALTEECAHDALQMLSDHLIDRVVLQSINYSLHHHPDNPHVIQGPAQPLVGKQLDKAKIAARLEQITIEQP